jgi:hypothetical protein
MNVLHMTPAIIYTLGYMKSITLCHIVTAPQNLVLEETIRFANTFQIFPGSSQYIFDFQRDLSLIIK